MKTFTEKLSKLLNYLNLTLFQDAGQNGSIETTLLHLETGKLFAGSAKRTLERSALDQQLSKPRLYLGSLWLQQGTWFTSKNSRRKNMWKSVCEWYILWNWQHLHFHCLSWTQFEDSPKCDMNHMPQQSIQCFGDIAACTTVVTNQQTDRWADRVWLPCL